MELFAACLLIATGVLRPVDALACCVIPAMSTPIGLFVRTQSFLRNGALERLRESLATPPDPHADIADCIVLLRGGVSLY